MNRLYFPKQFWIVLLALIGLLVLAACSVGTNPLQTAVNPLSPINTQSNGIQSGQNSGEWDAATFFAATCASCHGPTGEGSTFAPALNQEHIRSADTAWLMETISYGRSGTAMPAWSVEAGGPLSSDQIAAMADFLQVGNWGTGNDIAQQQPGFPMGNGRGGMMSGMMGGMGNHGNGMMGGMNNK